MNTSAGEEQQVRIEALSAITLAVRDMRTSVRFYEALGFEVRHGGASEDFTSLECGPSFLNLIAQTHERIEGWGRFIVHVSDVDQIYKKALDAGLTPSHAPSDAPWGERYFHISDPDGHELSVARPLG
ncbi:VOC family protein [Pararobbsia alpina]|uniref:VOC domain-containing protein n=1 Tax=Pararobbsia alpina TaxID=621374 RepID=A0A6S7BIT2_9BURK|nr:VOC family protein [Pararobbsia alpina]CAB3792707.1 hypothetical protein LMG28138_03381 [Pararobbsia alpina]